MNPGLQEEQEAGEKEVTSSSSADLVSLLGSIRPFARQLGLPTYPDYYTLEGDVLLYQPKQPDKENRRLYFSDGVLIELIGDNSHSVLNSYCINFHGNLNHLHTTRFSGDSQLTSTQNPYEMFMQLKAFVEGRCSEFEEGVKPDNGGFKLEGKGREIYFPHRYDSLSEENLLAFVPPDHLFAGKPSLFDEARDQALNNGYNETSKHKILILLAKNRVSFDTKCHYTFWMV